MSLARMMQMAAAGSAGAGPEPSGWTDPDLGNASYDSVSFSVAGQETSPQSIFFGDSATKLYVVGDTGNDVNQYSLSTAWDITTASFVQSFSVNSQETTPEGIFFKPDGTKMYICGNASDSVHEYNLATAWDISTASFNQSFSVSAQEGAPRAVSFKPDGTTMLIGGPVSDSILQYSLSTAWDTSTASYVQNFSISAQETILQSMFVNEDGTSLMLVGQQGLDVNRYSLSTAWDVSTMSYVENFSVSAQDTAPEGLFFKSDGSKMYYCASNTDTIYQYSTAAAAPAEWTDPYLANASYDSVSFDVIQDIAPFDCFFKPDGTKMYVVGQGNDALYQYTLSTAWDLSSASYDSVSFSLSSQDTATLGIFFKPDGTKFYVAGNVNDSIFEYDLSTAWDISTASYSTNSFSAASQDTTVAGVFFKDDGSKMYVLGLVGDSVYQYSLSTNWDVSTASYDSKSVSTSPQGEVNPSGLFINPQGTKIWISGTSNDTVAQYSMSTAWDLSTASYDGIALSVGPLLGGPRGFFFKPDGAKMYIVNSNDDTIYQYSTA